MAISRLVEYAPDYAIHPGECFGIGPEQLSLTLEKQAHMSADIAVRLENYLSISASIWNKLGVDYELFASKRGGR